MLKWKQFFFFHFQPNIDSELWAEQFVWLEVCVLTIERSGKRGIPAYCISADCDQVISRNQLEADSIIVDFQKLMKFLYDPNLNQFSVAG